MMKYRFKNLIGANDNIIREEDFIGKYEKDLIRKAYEYKISFNENDYNKTNWDKLINNIEEWEIAVKIAKEYGIDHNKYLGDIISLNQVIEEIEEKESFYSKDLHNYYNSTQC